MIQIKLTKNNELELSDKKSIVVLSGPVIKVNSETFDHSGEYESSGIEAIYGTGAALIVWERLQVVYVFSAEAPTSFESSQFSSCDVLLIGDGIAELNKTNLTTFIDAYDPRAAVVTTKTAIEATYRDSLKLQEAPIVKLAEQTLPVEGRDFYLLG